MQNPIFVRKLNRQMILGELKMSGSTDPDVLYSVKSKLVSPSKGATWYSIALIVVGLFLCITIIGLPIGVMLLLMGAIALFRARRNVSAVNAAFEDFTKAPV